MGSKVRAHYGRLLVMVGALAALWPLPGRAEYRREPVLISGEAVLDIPGVRRGTRGWMVRVFDRSEGGAELTWCGNEGSRDLLFISGGRSTFRMKTCRMGDVERLRGLAEAYLQFYYEAPVGTDSRAIPIAGGQFESVPVGVPKRVIIRRERGRLVIVLPRP